MTYLPTEEDLALLKSRSKRLYCRIELLNKDYQIIDTIEGLALSGSNSIDADSDTRRTFNLDIFPKSGFSISQFSTEEWTSKMLRLQIGMKAPTSMPLVGADAVRIPEEEIDAKIKNSAIYKEKDTELRQAKWRYKVGGYEQYGNIENINRKRIIWTDENKEKYASFVKEQGDVGTYSTVVASSDGYTASVAGGSGLVPAPAAGKQGQYLRGDGTWATPTNTTYSDATQSAHGLMSTADKKKLDGFGAASTYALKSDITAMYRYKGSVTSTDKLPTSGQTIGDVYDVGNGMNYAWNGSAWDALGEIFTITKITNTEIDTVLAS